MPSWSVELPSPATPARALPAFVDDPALSPDSKQVAFTWRSETQARANLFVQLIGADQPLRLTHNTSEFICCAAWSAEGQQIAYAHCDENAGAVFVVPALGGVEWKVTEVACPFTFNVAGWPQWTPDGESLVLAINAPRMVVVFSLRTGQKNWLRAPPRAGIQGMSIRL